MSSNETERARLNRRIRILDKDLAKLLKKYRRQITGEGQYRGNNVPMVFVPRGDSGFFEPADTISKCHLFLDKHDVEFDPAAPSRK